MISTIVLNWNRAELLERTLQSFAQTRAGPYELIVVDNGSTDRSREVIEESRRAIPDVQAIYHAENRGGEGLNAAIERARGDLIQIHENDIVLLAGWREHVAEAFESFGDLGQLSLFNGIPIDAYPGEPQPATLRFARGKILYEAHANVGTSSILRAELFRRHGVRVRSIPSADAQAFTFPDDVGLSNDVKAAGYWCAWSDRLYVTNLGHDPYEFERAPDYYRHNYASKPWLGIAAWERRVAAASAQPRPRRYSAVFGDAEVQPERTAGTCAGTPARLWSMFDGVTPEVEVLDVLNALVRLVKPRHALDASAWLGRSTVAIAAALRDNGFGAVDALVRDAERGTTAAANVAAAGLGSLVTERGEDDEREPGSAPFDFAFFGSRTTAELGRRYDEFADGATLLFHGPAATESPAPASLEALATTGLLHGCALTAPRGLYAAILSKPPDGVLRSVPANFDAERYLDANPDVARAGLDGAEHYRRFGWREARAVGEGSAPRTESYAAWQASFKQAGGWDEMYRRGEWDYLAGIGEVPRYAVAAGYVQKLLTGGDVLDAGAGEGIFADYLDLSRFRYTGFDLSPVAIDRARTRLRSGTVFVSSIEAFVPRASARYAAIVFSESVLHTDTPLESLDRYRGFLTGDGIIVISLHTPHDHGRGARLARIIAAECERGRYALIDRAAAVSVSHGLTWEILVLR